MELIWKDRKRTLFGLPLSFTKYELDEERLFIKTGVLTQKEDEVRLYRIMDLSLTKNSLSQCSGKAQIHNAIKRIFGVGTIHCSSGDKTLGDFDIVSVKNPSEVKETLSKLVETQRDKKRVTNREHMTAQSDDGMDDLI